MSEPVERREIKNSIWLAIFFSTALLLCFLIGLWFYQTVSNDVFAIETTATTDESSATTAGDDRPVVQVANGTNLDGQAGEVNRRLAQKDFVTLNPINADSTNQSVVYYTNQNGSRLPEAELIAALFGIQVVEPRPPEIEAADFDPEAELLVIIGRDAQL